MENKITLFRLSLSLKTLAVALIFMLMIGYAVSLIQVYHRSHFDLNQTVKYYRGDSSENESLMLPQSFTTMLSIAHVHSFSQPFIFGAIGFIFAFSSLSQRKKSFLIALGFLGSLVSNMAPWLIRYTVPASVFLFPLSQIMIAVSLIVMSGVSLKELWRK